MNSLLALIGLRSAALGLSLAGQAKVAASLYLLADALESGRATEEHLREVAAKLNAREINEDDWADVARRIDEASSRLQSVQPGGGEVNP